MTFNSEMWLFTCFVLCSVAIHGVVSTTCGQSKCDDSRVFGGCCNIDSKDCCCYVDGYSCESSTSFPAYGIVLIVLLIIGLTVGGAVGCWWYRKRSRASYSSI